MLFCNLVSITRHSYFARRSSWPRLKVSHLILRSCVLLAWTTRLRWRHSHPGGTAISVTTQTLKEATGEQRIVGYAVPRHERRISVLVTVVVSAWLASYLLLTLSSPNSVTADTVSLSLRKASQCNVYPLDPKKPLLSL